MNTQYTGTLMSDLNRLKEVIPMTCPKCGSTMRCEECGFVQYDEETLALRAEVRREQAQCKTILGYIPTYQEAIAKGLISAEVLGRFDRYRGGDMAQQVREAMLIIFAQIQCKTILGYIPTYQEAIAKGLIKP